MAAPVADESKTDDDLVHGAWTDATGFDAEFRALQREEFRAIGFANPLRDLVGGSTCLAEFLPTLTGPIVLVGHSFSRNVISTAADQATTRSSAARLCRRIEMRRSGASGAPRRVRGRPRRGPRSGPCPSPARTGAGSRPAPRANGLPEAFAADVDQATAERHRRCAATRARCCRVRRRAVGPAGVEDAAVLVPTSAPRTRRSRRRCSSSSPSARTRRSWRCGLRRSLSSRSPTPRPSSSFRPSRRPCRRTVEPRNPARTLMSPASARDEKRWSDLEGPHMRRAPARKPGVGARFPCRAACLSDGWTAPTRRCRRRRRAARRCAAQPAQSQ